MQGAYVPAVCLWNFFPCPSIQPDFLNELEKTMALLAFEEQTTSPVGHLLDHAQRQKTASELNAAILTAQCQEKGREGRGEYEVLRRSLTHRHPVFYADPKLPALLKMLIWAQQQLGEKATYPRITNIATAEYEQAATGSATDVGQ